MKIYVLTGLILFILGLLFLVDVVRFRTKTFLFLKFGLIFVGIVFGLDAVVLISNPAVFRQVPLGFLIFGNLVGIAKIMIFVTAGLYYCSLHNFCPLPIMSGQKTISPRYVKILTLGFMAAFTYSYLLFKITDPQIPATLKIQKQALSPFVTALVMLELAIVEEIIFRLGIQNFIVKVFNLENRQYWIAILITSFFWAASHLGTLDPAWVKFVQVFPVGIMLGFFFKKYGMESTLFVHGAYNIGMAMIS
ncbi:hypothetical protein BuS5_04029 (plasmid) [Desulfosarcina sp. BuS5]|nr:hypothetical protein BuS5_04029 [Desulfosarcina sp. BuS5]